MVNNVIKKKKGGGGGKNKGAKKPKKSPKPNLQQPKAKVSTGPTERKVGITWGHLIWIVFFIIVTWLALSVFGAPLSVIGWLMGINPTMIMFTIILICFIFMMIIRSTIRGKS